MRLTLVFLIIIAAESRGGRPRVYNALISTNQELLPSRAYPAVSPVIGQPVYLTSSVEIHHKEQHSESQQPYQEPPFEYQGQEIDQTNYDSYDDHQFQGYDREEPLQEDRHAPVPDNSRSEGHITQELVRPPQASARIQQEVARHAARPPALQEQGRKPFLRPRHHPHPDDDWADEEEPAPARRPVQRAQPDSRTPPTKVPKPQPSPQPGRPGKPPLLSDFQTIGGIPLNNQPGNIPVVPPPPIPIRLSK